MGRSSLEATKAWWMRAVWAVERAVLVVLRPDLRTVLGRAVVLPDLCAAVAGVFFFFLAAVEFLLELLLLVSVVLWLDAAYNAGDTDATRAAARISGPAKRLRIKREVGEFCTLIYPL
jgi:hypothetical protein